METNYELIFTNCTETDFNLLQYMCKFYRNSPLGAGGSLYYPRVRFDNSMAARLEFLPRSFAKCVIIQFIEFSSALNFLVFLAELETQASDNKDLDLLTKDFSLAESPTIYRCLSGDFLGMIYYKQTFLTVNQLLKLFSSNTSLDALKLFSDLVQTPFQSFFYIIFKLIDYKQQQLLAFSNLFF